MFDFRHAASFAPRYLDTFYRNAPATNDEREVLGFVVQQLRSIQTGGTLLEVGCGPTLHHILPFVPHFSRIHMADYLPDNLEEIERWRTSAPGAMDWSEYSRLVLTLEGSDTGVAAVREREAEARQRLHALMRCDLKEPQILGVDATYPAVGAFYCTEEVGISIPAWERVMANLSRVVARGGRLFLACLADTDGYLVGDTIYPCARITGEDVRRVLQDLGFDMARSTVRAQAIAGQEREGVVGVILASAEKR